MSGPPTSNGGHTGPGVGETRSTPAPHPGMAGIQQLRRRDSPPSNGQRTQVLLVTYAVAAVAALITLRANIDALDFMSIGWMLILVSLPLLPWLLPRVSEFVKGVSPYVQTFKLGSLQVDLRAVKREVVSVPSAGVLAAVPNDYGALSSGTAISHLVASLAELRRAGGSPAGIIDLRDGRKWRLPNLYFLGRLLDSEPIVSELVFTEMRGGTDGFLVGTCSPGELRRQVEQTVARYGDASSGLQWPVGLDLRDASRAQDMGNAFQALLNALGPPSWNDDDPVHGWVTSERIQKILDELLDRATVDESTGTLSERSVRAVLSSRHRFVPMTSGGRVAGLVDRDAVALVVARAALAQP